MRSILAKTSNVRKLQDAYSILANRAHGVPGMGMIYGYTGFGKTTAVAWLVNQVNGVYVRAISTWTPSSMLSTICREIGLPGTTKNATALSAIIEHLSLTERPLFVDEADYLLPNLTMLEALRDIHDMSGMPVIIVGMEGINRKILRREQFSRRISQWVEFQPCDGEDVRTVAEAICEVAIAPDMQQKLLSATKGSIGLLTVALSRIEQYAKPLGLNPVTVSDWGDRELFLARQGGTIA